MCIPSVSSESCGTACSVLHSALKLPAAFPGTGTYGENIQSTERVCISSWLRGLLDSRESFSYTTQTAHLWMCHNDTLARSAAHKNAHSAYTVELFQPLINHLLQPVVHFKAFLANGFSQCGLRDVVINKCNCTE